jgi:hypothetical protein
MLCNVHLIPFLIVSWAAVSTRLTSCHVSIGGGFDGHAGYESTELARELCDEILSGV